FTRGKKRRDNLAYHRIALRMSRLKKKGATREILEPFRKELKPLSSVDPMDPDFRRLRYVRYADDFLLGFAGPKDEAEEIKAAIGEFLNESLKLELSPQKTLITHAGTEDARFLGHDVGAIW